MADHRTPGQLISELLRQRGWTQRTLAIVLEKHEGTINKIISGKSAVTPETALALEELFGRPADEFLALQRSYDLALARFATRPDPGRATRAQLFGDLPISEMIARGWLRAESSQNIKEVEDALSRFFGVSSVQEIEILPHAARKTAVNSQPTPAQLAWLYRVREIAKDLMVGRYSAKTLQRAISSLSTLRGAAEEARKVPRILAEAGVRFVIVESLPGAKIDGVCYWLRDDAPVVGLSMRHDRIDNFWFVLRHELEHVRLGHGHNWMILDTELEGERAGTGANVPEDERMANQAAEDFCVPRDQMNAFIERKAPLFTERDLIGFSRSLKVHAGIVAGQLQYRTDRYDRFRQHLAKVFAHIRTGAAVDGWGDVYPVND